MATAFSERMLLKYLNSTIYDFLFVLFKFLAMEVLIELLL